MTLLSSAQTNVRGLRSNIAASGADVLGA